MRYLGCEEKGRESLPEVTLMGTKISASCPKKYVGKRYYVLFAIGVPEHVQSQGLELALKDFLVVTAELTRPKKSKREKPNDKFETGSDSE